MNGILTACYLLIALNFKVESKVDKIVKFFKAENADWWSIVKTYLEGYTFSGMCRKGDTVSMVRAYIQLYSSVKLMYCNVITFYAHFFIAQHVRFLSVSNAWDIICIL